jgi:protein-S-isoprenylcysteine O-methyltransferase Ste14
MLWLRTLLFAVLIPGTALVAVPRWVVAGSGLTVSPSPAARSGGALLLVLGAALMLWCWAEFVTRGRGTPAPYDPPRRLVVVGPYRHVRNPMYVAGALIILGQAALYASTGLLWYAAAFVVAAHVFVVAYEEQTLADRFGADYAAYRGAVGRWLPRLRPYEHHAPAG